MSEGGAVFAMLLGMGLVWGDDMRSIRTLHGRVSLAEAKAAAYLKSAESRRISTVNDRVSLSVSPSNKINSVPVSTDGTPNNLQSRVLESIPVH